MKLENDLRPMKFIEIWVRKESFIKAVGAGMSIDFTKFFFEPISDMLWKVTHSINDSNYYIKDLETFDESYRAAICCETRDIL